MIVGNAVYVDGRRAEEMLFDLANDGHIRVTARDGALAYALWD